MSVPISHKPSTHPMIGNELSSHAQIDDDNKRQRSYNSLTLVENSN